MTSVSGEGITVSAKKKILEIKNLLDNLDQTERLQYFPKQRLDQRTSTHRVLLPVGPRKIALGF